MEKRTSLWLLLLSLQSEEQGHLLSVTVHVPATGRFSQPLSVCLEQDRACQSGQSLECCTSSRCFFLLPTGPCTQQLGFSYLEVYKHLEFAEPQESAG